MNWRQNPGRCANDYHRRFSRVIGHSSLDDIQRAMEMGAVTSSHDGFHQRNTVVATTCDRTISLTWGRGNVPTSGGSLDQWTKCSAPKMHISLHTLKR